MNKWKSLAATRSREIAGTPNKNPLRYGNGMGPAYGKRVSLLNFPGEIPNGWRA